MAYRRSSGKSSWRKLKASDVLPLWTSAHTDTANLAVQSAMMRLGIFSIRDYFHKLRVLIVICAVLGAVIGAAEYGLQGFFLAGILGMAAPAAAIWICVTLFVVAIYMLAYCIGMALVICLLLWFIRALVGG
jgi:hypothetical protein